MKNNFILLSVSFFVLYFTSPVFAAEVTVDSRISQVTVYSDSALINRTASLKLNAGGYKIIFPGIIPMVDENSLRVTTSAGEEIRLLGAQLKTEFLEEASAERIKDLQARIQKLEDEIKGIQNLQSILADEKHFLNSIRLFSEGQLPKDLVTRMPIAKDLEETLKLLDTKLKDNYSQGLDCEVKLRDLNKSLDVLRRELNEISGQANQSRRSIVVELEALKPANFALTVAYLVKGASWQPIYDARADFEKQEVEMIAYGIVQQTTGEDWKDIEMSLSTAKPAIGGSLPYVSSWIIRPAQPPMPMRPAMSLGKARGVQYEAYDMAQAGATNLAVKEEVYATAEEKGTAVSYKLPRSADIKSDGTEHKLPISTQILKAAFEYSTYPRIIPSAYLGSRVTNAKYLQLLAGKVNIFLTGDFVGTSTISNIGPGEEFDLYLGVDENVKVKKELIEKKVDDILIAGIPSPNKHLTFKYKLSVENYKHKKIKVILFDAVPVSENERIKIKIGQVSLELKEKDWKDRKGVWRWELDLEPQAKQEIFYTFSVEHPRDMLVEGL